MSNSKRAVAPIDRIVASRIRYRRRFLGLSMEQMAERLGVSHQQVHKYEVGTNRLSAARLIEIADALYCVATDLLAGIYFKDGVLVDEYPHLSEPTAPAANDAAETEAAA